jgi:hypothetical protein
MCNEDNLPKCINYFSKSFTPWIDIYYVSEDRVPNLTEEEAKIQLGYKYKIQFGFTFFHIKFHRIIRSLSYGYIETNIKFDEE